MDPFNSDALHPMVFPSPRVTEKSSRNFLRGIRNFLWLANCVSLCYTVRRRYGVDMKVIKLYYNRSVEPKYFVYVRNDTDKRRFLCDLPCV